MPHEMILIDEWQPTYSFTTSKTQNFSKCYSISQLMSIFSHILVTPIIWAWGLLWIKKKLLHSATNFATFQVLIMSIKHLCYSTETCKVLLNRPPSWNMPTWCNRCTNMHQRCANEHSLCANTHNLGLYPSTTNLRSPSITTCVITLQSVIGWMVTTVISLR